MRLAEFKTRLFVFVAGRLLRWAKSSERETVSRGATVPTTASVLPLDPALGDGVDSSGPPEHWLRLINTPAPQHWLDLLATRSPDPESTEATAALESPLVESVAPEQLQGLPEPKELAVNRGHPERRNANVFSETKPPPRVANRTSWLDRLQFRRNTQEVSDDSLQASAPLERAQARGANLKSVFESRSPASRPNFGEPQREASERAGRPSEFFPVAAKDAGDGNGVRFFPTPATASSNNSDPSFVSRGPSHSPEQFATEATSAEALIETEVRRRTLRSDTGRTARKSSTRAELAGDDSSATEDSSAPELPAHPSEVNFAEAAARSADVFALVLSDEPASGRGGRDERTRRFVGRAQPVSSPRLPPPNPSRVTTASRPGRNETQFVATAQKRSAPAPNWTSDSSATASIKARRMSSEPAESVWPSLPPSRAFEFADELAAAEREDDSLRRLRSEQRGTLWNA
ncbi:MAG: hypothetical protein QOD33_312 [Pyrinomonadaceae bacterium]|nr:hypothetical protein [Pyrinomonadaceae bacterium]